jgi:CBS domain-containing protein
MRLADLLVDAWAAVPLEAADLGDALRGILMFAAAAGALDESRALKLARDLAFGSQGEVIRVNDDIIIVVGTLESLSGPGIGVGVSRAPFTVTAEGRPVRGEARGVVLLLASGKLTGARQQIAPAIAKALRDRGRTERFLAARSVADIRGMKEFMGTEFRARLLVEDALVPARYRVYPDTPLPEVVDLMARRGVRAVPVVGERYEVLGILTAGDALGHLLRSGRQGEKDEPVDMGAVVARDVMTRTVLCVAEGQELVEAANMLVNRDVEQLPVVREGEFIGFVTRDTVLKALFGEPDVEGLDEPDNKSES